MMGRGPALQHWVRWLKTTLVAAAGQNGGRARSLGRFGFESKRDGVVGSDFSHFRHPWEWRGGSSGATEQSHPPEKQCTLVPSARMTVTRFAPLGRNFWCSISLENCRTGPDIDPSFLLGPCKVPDTCNAAFTCLPRAFSSKGVDDDSIQDFNSELELVFGSHPESPQLGGKQVLANDLREVVAEHSTLAACKSVVLGAENVPKFETLSHIDAAGKAAMVNVSVKADSKRVAVATGKVYLGLKAFNLVAANNISKGDVLTVAKIAGIQGAKLTSSLIPLCHNILLSGVDVTLTLNEEFYSIDIKAEVTASGPTGVEMEALTAVSVASLTVYDMCKAVSKDITISNVQLFSKTGGKSGDWLRYINDCDQMGQKCI